MKCISFNMNVRTVLRNIAMLVIILSGSSKTVAQEWDHEYFPFVEEGKVWNCWTGSPSGAHKDPLEAITCIFTMSGDTLINDNTYKKVSCQFKDFYGDEEQHYYCAVREETYRVFIVEAESKEEKMLYDFSHPQENLILSYDGQKFIREAGYHFNFGGIEQLCYGLFGEKEGEKDYYNFYGNFWIEGAGACYSNPFAFGLHGDESDPFFGYPFILITCMKGEKRMFHADWIIIMQASYSDPEDEEEEGDLTSIQEMSKSTSDAPIYDLQGRRLSTIPQKGVYIQNGKKKLVK